MTPPTSITRCPACGRSFKNLLRHRGRRVRCPLCGESVRVPVASASPGWQSQCAAVVVRLARLLEIARREKTAAAVVTLMGQLPCSEAELHTIPKTTLLWRCLLETINGDDREREDLIGFLRRVAELPPARRALLEESVVGVLLGLGLAL